METTTQETKMGDDRTFVLQQVKQYKPTKNRPGLPVSNLPSACGPALQSLLNEGSVHIIEVVKPEKQMTYRYLVAA